MPSDSVCEKMKDIIEKYSNGIHDSTQWFQEDDFGVRQIEPLVKELAEVQAAELSRLREEVERLKRQCHAETENAVFAKQALEDIAAMNHDRTAVGVAKMALEILNEKPLTTKES